MPLNHHLYFVSPFQSRLHCVNNGVAVCTLPLLCRGNVLLDACCCVDVRETVCSVVLVVVVVVALSRWYCHVCPVRLSVPLLLRLR